VGRGALLLACTLLLGPSASSAQDPGRSSASERLPAPAPIPVPDLPGDSLGTSVPSVAAPSAAAPSRIVRIEAAGFATVDSLVVVRTFGLHVGDAYERSAVGDGVRRLFATGLFTDVKVTDAPADSGVALTVRVEERARVKGVVFRGMKKLDEKDVRGTLTVADGQLLDRGTLDLDARKIEGKYAEHGYAHARVTPRSEAVGRGEVQVVFDIAEGPKVQVRAITIHGNEHLEAGGLASAMKTRTPGFLRGGAFKPARLEQDETALRLYMRSRGYKDAEVDSIRAVDTADGKGVTLHVYVREGPPYRFGRLEWTGNTTLKEPALQAITVPKPGTPYNETQVQKTLESAYTLYQEHGFLFLSIDPQMADRDSTVDVTFKVEEGARSRVAELAIVGNTRTKENVIRREASVRPGDTFRRSTLVRTQRDIFGLGFFQDVTVDYEPTGDSADIKLTLKVQEKQTGTASAGAGFSSQSGLTGFIELGHNNLFGNGQSVQLRLERGGKRNDLELSFTEPWFRDTPLTLGFDVFNTNRDLDFYDRRDVGGGIRLGRPIGWPDYTRASLSYDLRDVTLSNFQLPRPGEPANLQALRETDWPRRVSSVTLTFNRNSTDNPFYAARGSRLTWLNQLAGGLFGGVEHYYRETVENRNYTRLRGPFVLMLREKAGYMGGHTLPDYERFRLGGTTSDYLRGYPDYYVVPRANITRNPVTGAVIDRYPGGRSMLILTSEIQFLIAEPLHGLVFFEGGNTWNSTRDLDLGDLRKSIGFGVRLEIPALGRVGLDLGYGLDKEEGAGWEPHFQLGNTF
jgi:outer membrane protein insertion porin family